MDYKSAGVDVEAGRAFVERIKRLWKPSPTWGHWWPWRFWRADASSSRIAQALAGVRTDGVGTKLELAEHRSHHGVGVDLVAMCVNDVITSGAAPLFSGLHGHRSPSAIGNGRVVEGIADGCQQSGCALLGGETAEMPGFYPPGRYDLAGFCVAVVKKTSSLTASASSLVTA